MRGKPSQGHLTGRYRDDASSPADREAREQRVRRPGCALAFGLLLGILAAALVSAAALCFLLRTDEPVAHNAIWLGIDWGQQTHADEDVRELAQLLRVEGIDTVYVWTSWLQEDATWSETTFANIGAFVGQFRRFYPEARILAWIGLPVDVPEYRIGDEEIRAEVADFSGQVIADYAFDGIHLNAEPVWNDDTNFIALLRDVRQAVGEEALLSVAVPPDWNTGDPAVPAGPYTTADAHWTQEYKQRVAFLVDELAIMAYNSGLSSPMDYQIWMAYQVTRYLDALASLDIDTHLVIGIPTYDAEPPGHDPTAESIPAAISGIRAGIAQGGEAASRVRGVGIYAYWSTDAVDWNTYRQLWMQPAQEP